MVVRLRRTGGRRQRRIAALRYPNQELSDKGGEPFVARLWANLMIGALLEQVRRNGSNQEVVDAIVDLSMRYGIVTPYTSYLVVEPMMAQGAPTAPDNQVMLQARSLRGKAAAAVADRAAAMVDQAAAGPAAVQGQRRARRSPGGGNHRRRSGRALCERTHLHTPGSGDRARGAVSSSCGLTRASRKRCRRRPSSLAVTPTSSCSTSPAWPNGSPSRLNS